MIFESYFGNFPVIQLWYRLSIAGWDRSLDELGIADVVGPEFRKKRTALEQLLGIGKNEIWGHTL